MSSKTCEHDVNDHWEELKLRDDLYKGVLKSHYPTCPFCKEQVEASEKLLDSISKFKKPKQDKHSESEIKRYSLYPNAPHLMTTNPNGNYVLYSDHQEALTSQAKLYEGQIDSLEKALGWFSGRIGENEFYSMNIDQQLQHFKYADEALANLAEFRKGLK